VKISDVISCAQQKRGDYFASWISFQCKWEAVMNKDGEIITENVPGDSGGLTFCGVDKANHPYFPFRSPTPSDVVSSYELDWNAIHGDHLPSPVGFVVANYSVNTGPNRAGKLLQLSSLAIPNQDPLVIDGWIGPKTMESVTAQNPVMLAHRVIIAADGFYRALAEHHQGLRKFLSGWLNRNRALDAAIGDVLKSTVTTAIAVNPTYNKEATV
jgi:lysozyme family protein